MATDNTTANIKPIYVQWQQTTQNTIIKQSTDRRPAYLGRLLAVVLNPAQMLLHAPLLLLNAHLLLRVQL